MPHGLKGLREINQKFVLSFVPGGGERRHVTRPAGESSCCRLRHQRATGQPSARIPRPNQPRAVGQLARPGADRPRVLGSPLLKQRDPRVCIKRSADAKTFNDPSAGSPTETLLRLLLPLNASVWSTSRKSVSVSQLKHNPWTSLKRSIGSSDGRCVQRAGT